MGDATAAKDRPCRVCSTPVPGVGRSRAALCSPACRALAAATATTDPRYRLILAATVPFPCKTARAWLILGE